MNSRNSLTNPITSDKLKCQWPRYVASRFLCCSVISPTADMSQQHFAVCRIVWEGLEDRGTVTGDPGRCLSLSIDWTRRPDDCNRRRQAGRHMGYLLLHHGCSWKEQSLKFDMTHCHTALWTREYVSRVHTAITRLKTPSSVVSQTQTALIYIFTQCFCCTACFLVSSCRGFVSQTSWQPQPQFAGKLYINNG